MVLNARACMICAEPTKSVSGFCYACDHSYRATFNKRHVSLADNLHHPNTARDFAVWAAERSRKFEIARQKKRDV